MKRPVVRIHIWMESDGKTLLGLGRARLLERVELLGSLKKAAESLGMSYRAAWGKVKDSEKALGFQLLEKSGGNRKGYRLTVFGKCLADAYRSWFEEVEQNAVALARSKFPFDPVLFCERDQAGEETVEDEDASAPFSGPDAPAALSGGAVRAEEAL